MNYYFSLDYVKGLLLLEEKIFNEYQKLKIFKKGTKDFYKVIGNLEKLSFEEDKYLELIPDLISSIDRINIYVRNNLANYNEFILNRFDDLLNKKSCIIDNNSEEKGNYFERLSVYREIKNNYYIKYIKSICKDDSHMWLIPSYINKDISDELIRLNFDVDSLDESRIYDIIYDREIFVQMYDETMYDECLDLLEEMIINYSDKKLPLTNNYNFSFLKYLLVNISDLDFQKIYGRLSDDLSKIDYDLSYLSDLFNFVYDERYSTIYTKDIDMVNLIELFKLEEVILEKYRNCDDNVIGNLIEFESEFISLIDLDIVNDINNIIENDLELYINSDNEDLYLIKNRIFNLFSKFYYVNCIFKNYETIISNHIVRTLDRYNIELSNLEFRNILFMYPFLDKKFLMSYSDDMSSMLLGLNSDLDYSYDKSEQLYYLGVRIIDELCDYENISYLDKIIDFKIMEFDDIISNVSDENLCLLREKLLSSSLSDNKFIKLKNLERSMIYGKRS